MGGGPDWGGYDHLASVVRGLLPLIVQAGIATAEPLRQSSRAQQDAPATRIEVRTSVQLAAEPISWALYSGNIFHRYATW